MSHMNLPKNSSTAVLAENLQRNESEPVLDQKNTRSAKHIEIRVNVNGANCTNEGAAAGGENENWRQQRASALRKDRQSKDRHGKDRSSGSSRTEEPRRRPPSGQYSETGSTEYSYSETGYFLICFHTMTVSLFEEAVCFGKHGYESSS